MPGWTAERPGVAAGAAGNSRGAAAVEPRRRLAVRIAFWSLWPVVCVTVAWRVGSAGRADDFAPATDVPTPAVERAALPASGDATIETLRRELAATQSLVRDLRASMSVERPDEDSRSGLAWLGSLALGLCALAGLALTVWAHRAARREKAALAAYRRRACGPPQSVYGLLPHLPDGAIERRRAAPNAAARQARAAEVARDAERIRRRVAAIEASRRAKALCRVELGPLAEQARLLRESIISRENLAAACFAIGRVPSFVTRPSAAECEPSAATISSCDSEDAAVTEVAASRPAVPDPDENTARAA